MSGPPNWPPRDEDSVGGVAPDGERAAEDEPAPRMAWRSAAAGPGFPAPGGAGTFPVHSRAVAVGANAPLRAWRPPSRFVAALDAVPASSARAVLAVAVLSGAIVAGSHSASASRSCCWRSA